MSTTAFTREPHTDDERTRVVVRRGLQWYVDGVLSALLLLPPLALFLLLPTDEDGATLRPAWALVLFAVWGLLSLLVYVWYWVVRPARTGRTWGMSLFGLRVVRLDGRPLTYGGSFLRAVLLVVDGMCAGLVGLVAMLVTPRRQRLGDLAAGTVVIRDR
ncbi:RDD family protein [Streptomyces sp. NPDC004111]|uniref:RDD family protein n=1 Tax=Streptomyces sp. NPDC004111 TaxID=3364690 RepID=UPI0036812356